LSSLRLDSHLCRWCCCGSSRKSVHPHHPHRKKWTRGRVPLVLLACCPDWKMQPYWEPRFPCELRF
ncbi:unnamed protein product, partial [Staurois parvus]